MRAAAVGILVVVAFWADMGISEEQEPPTEFHKLVVHDWRGEPLADAKVKVYGFSFHVPNSFHFHGRRPSAKYLSPGKTDIQGGLRIAHPAWDVNGKLKGDVVGLSVVISHPDHPYWSGYIGTDKETPVRLPRPYQVRATVQLGEDGPNVTQSVYALLLTDGMYDRLSLRTVGRKFVSAPVALQDSAGVRGAFRFVHRSPTGKVFFSQQLTMRHSENRIIEVEAILKPAIEVKGRLADDFPRPIKNGFVVVAATGHDDEESRIMWHTLSKIAPDGQFRIQNLPAPCHLQYVVICDRGTSQPSLPLELEKYENDHEPVFWTTVGIKNEFGPRLEFVVRDQQEIEVPMRQTATVQVTVVDKDGQPLQGAKVQFRPRMLMFHGNGGVVPLFGAGGGETLDYLRDDTNRWSTPDVTERERVSEARFAATTNSKGVAVVDGLPATQDWDLIEEKTTNRVLTYTVTKSGYVLTSSDRIVDANQDHMSITVKPGATIDATVQLSQQPLSEGER
jgi:hypothetical protein